MPWKPEGAQGIDPDSAGRTFGLRCSAFVLARIVVSLDQAAYMTSVVSTAKKATTSDIYIDETGGRRPPGPPGCG